MAAKKRALARAAKLAGYTKEETQKIVEKSTPKILPSTPKTMQSPKLSPEELKKSQDSINDSMRRGAEIREQTKKVAESNEKPGFFKKYFTKQQPELTDFQKKTGEYLSKQSGGKFNAGDFVKEDDHWFTSNAKTQMVNRLNSNRSNLHAQMQGAKNEEELSRLMQDHGITYKKGMSYEELGKNIDARFQKDIKSGPSYGDYFHGNHGMGFAALGVAGISVLALSDSRGQRSNSDLYSSPF